MRRVLDVSSHGQTLAGWVIGLRIMKRSGPPPGATFQEYSLPHPTVPSLTSSPHSCSSPSNLPTGYISSPQLYSFSLISPGFTLASPWLPINICLVSKIKFPLCIHFGWVFCASRDAQVVFPGGMGWQLHSTTSFCSLFTAFQCVQTSAEFRPPIQEIQGSLTADSCLLFTTSIFCPLHTAPRIQIIFK